MTSKQSDALHDFEDQYRKEGGKASIKVAEMRLQGQQEPHEIAEAIKRFNREKTVDVIAIVRGGGRAADMAIFNDFLIAEAICQSKIPVITGIGPQTDNTFADQVADVSTITPSIAALHLARINPQPQAAVELSQPSQGVWRTYLMVGLGIVALVLLVLLLVSLNS